MSNTTEVNTQGGSNIEGNVDLNSGDFVGRDKIDYVHIGNTTISQITNVIRRPSIWQEVIRSLLLKKRRLLLQLFSATILLQVIFSFFFLRYKDRFLFSWWVYIFFAVFLAIITASWFNTIQPRSSKIYTHRPDKIVVILAIVWIGLLCIQVWMKLFPPQFASGQFGIAIATFGDGDAFRITQRGRQLTDLLFNRLDGTVRSTPGLPGEIALKPVGVVRNFDEALIEGQRVGAKLILWGQILEQNEGVILHFWVIESPGFTDDSAFPRVIPVVQPSYYSHLDIVKDSNSLVISEVASQHNLGLAAFCLGLYYYLEEQNPLLAAKNFEMALERLESVKSYNRETNLGLIYYYLGRSYQLQGRYKDSQQVLEQAAKLKPDDPAIVIGEAVESTERLKS